MVQWLGQRGKMHPYVTCLNSTLNINARTNFGEYNREEYMKKIAKVSKDYLSWIAELKRRYKSTQIKAAVAVNSAVLEFYWQLGRDICARYTEAKLGNEFYQQLSADLKSDMPEASGLSAQNLKYCGYFYRLYSLNEASPQVVDFSGGTSPQLVDFNKNAVTNASVDLNQQQAIVLMLMQVPWGHHRYIIDKCKGNREKALFYVRRTIQNGWSRATLLNWLSTNLYEREGKAQTNFALTMPSDACDLARQLIKDPQVFEIFDLEEEYQEVNLKKALVAAIERTLLSFGRGVAFVGREYVVELGGEEKQIDLLFYIIPLHRYLIVEVKTEKFEPADLGQLLGYKVMVKHSLNTEGDFEPIGLLVCKDHNRILAQYMIDELKTPLGITDYELKRILPPVERLQAAVKVCGGTSSAHTKAVKKHKEKAKE